MTNQGTVWAFKGTRRYPGFPSGVFSKLDLAERWIEKYVLTGVLTEYPVDIGAYDWALENNLLDLDDEDPNASLSSIVGNFSTAYQRHYHYSDGVRVS